MTAALIHKMNDLNDFNPEQRELFALLDQWGIAYDNWSHPPIFTVAEGEALGLHRHIPGQGGKSLLLKSKTGQLYLVVACEDTKVDLKKLALQSGAKRFSFASPDTMLEVLHVTPGSASPLALMHDKAHKIQVIIDENFLAHSHCVFHPLENKYSTVLAVPGLVRFVNELGYKPEIMAMN